MSYHLLFRQRHVRVPSCLMCLYAIVVLLSCGRSILAQDKEHRTAIGEMVVQTIPAKQYVYGSFETEFANMGEPVVKTLTELTAAAHEGKVGLYGPLVDFYYGAPHRNPDKRFKMEVGFFVAADTLEVGKFKTRELPVFKCATILYIGPAPQIGDAWQKLYRSVAAHGLTPTDEERELYLYWEDVDSPNNIVQVQLGVR